MLAVEKIIASFLSFPGLFLTVWGIILIYLLVKGKSVFIKLIAVSMFILMVITFTGLGIHLFLLPLENFAAYESDLYREELPVVVLGGGINYGTTPRGSTLSTNSLQRLVMGYRLYTELETLIIFSGGTGVGHAGDTEAGIARNWLQDMGVAAEDIVIEDKARTTYENGIYVQDWLAENNYDKIYLVTSAVHLFRSAAVFQKQGVDFIPVPAGYLYSHRLGWLDYLPNRGALTANLSALHEWLGIIWYRLRNRI